ncbi:MFS general substrate transporter [Rhizodiscina lignyota]|uniref:MFS general substrate transporter n=1 Tax=Rhizodiscina lignyota TaxID=1504668 RepID=A0A9P4M8W4_9PEZI|nr:MFS general substrate transporter [Rhizodiscina lignyota]
MAPPDGQQTALWQHNPLHAARHLQKRSQRRTQIINDIDRYGFDWTVWAVAARQVLPLEELNSYNLFATNQILPALSFVYWRDDTSIGHETWINVVTLLGSFVGQILFGFLADRFGRRRLYGLELIIVIFSTIGVAQSSEGANRSMSILGWLLPWRFFMGLGIGAEYPLSAIITSEWAAVGCRARMLASVFIMQSLGQLVATLVGFGVLEGFRHSTHFDTANDDELTRRTIDSAWRWVAGVGAIPALVAILFRLTIPESGRFTLDVANESKRALEETRGHYGLVSDIELGEGDEMEEVDGFSIPGSDATSAIEDPPDEALPVPFSVKDLRQYFLVEGNWRYLAGTSITWFLLDFAFYGLGINNPRTLAKLWQSKPITTHNNSTILAWQADASKPNATIYDVLHDNAVHQLITVSIGSVLGSMILIKVINYFPRKKGLSWSFIIMAIILAATGGSFLGTFQKSTFILTIFLYALCQFFFNLGPNSLTFILPAEIFPTRYRCTCHGISAASGKLGSIIVQAILPAISINGRKISDPNSNGLGYILIIFAAIMAFGSIFSWAWIPDVQNARTGKGYEIPSKGLEELAEGRTTAQREGQVISIRGKFRGLFKRK